MMSRLIELWEEAAPVRGRIIGGSVGFILGCVFLLFGFWKTMIFALIVAVGYTLGKIKDDIGNLKSVLQQILPDKFRSF
jgi:uncharacterized membrane protein